MNKKTLALLLIFALPASYAADAIKHTHGEREHTHKLPASGLNHNHNSQSKIKHESVAPAAFKGKKGTLLESKDEISCSSFSYIEHAAEGLLKYKDKGDLAGAYFRGWMSRADCNNLTEGMDIKVIKSQITSTGETGVLVKLPTGMTTWILR